MNTFEKAVLDIMWQWNEAIEQAFVLAKPYQVVELRKLDPVMLPDGLMKVALIGGQDRLLMEITGKFVHEEDGGIFFKIEVRDAQNDHGPGKTPEQKRNERRAERRRIDDAK